MFHQAGQPSDFANSGSVEEMRSLMKRTIRLVNWYIENNLLNTLSAVHTTQANSREQGDCTLSDKHVRLFLSHSMCVCVCVQTAQGSWIQLTLCSGQKKFCVNLRGRRVLREHNLILILKMFNIHILDMGV